MDCKNCRIADVHIDGTRLRSDNGYFSIPGEPSRVLLPSDWEVIAVRTHSDNEEEAGFIMSTSSGDVVTATVGGYEQPWHANKAYHADW